MTKITTGRAHRASVACRGRWATEAYIATAVRGTMNLAVFICSIPRHIPSGTVFREEILGALLVGDTSR